MRSFLTHYRCWLTMAAMFGLPLLNGCSESGMPDATDIPITTDMHEDFDHDHAHKHSGNDDHEHDHEDGFSGSHAHGHQHGHRHGAPLHGGRIVSIGHTHHKDGAKHFHAEVMPLDGNEVRIHLLAELDDGTSEDFPIEETSIVALISAEGQEALTEEVEFTGSERDSTAEFVMSLPESLSDSDAFTVVIPKLMLGGQRQDFSFKINRTAKDENSAAGNEAKE